jgi:hypothetical protein
MLSPHGARYSELLERYKDKPERARAIGETMRRFYPGLTRAFATRYGTIQDHWCRAAPAAAVLTARGSGFAKRPMCG